MASSPVGLRAGGGAVGVHCPRFDSLVGAAQWAGDRTRDQLLVLGGSVDPFTGIVIAPSESTIRRVLTKLDPRALTVACVAWTLARLRDVEQREAQAADEATAEQQGAQMGAKLKALAMDGKCVRGARRPDGSMPQFMAAVTHVRPVVVGRRQIPEKTGEILEALKDDSLVDPATNRPTSELFWSVADVWSAKRVSLAGAPEPGNGPVNEALHLGFDDVEGAAG